MRGKCKFQSAWLSNDDYKLWVAPDTSDPHRAKCTTCRKTFDIAKTAKAKAEELSSIETQIEKKLKDLP
ncbi:hypothetical protein HPB49_004549 [Dermacentor silvarum]|uniref:Uncharacterized protein n=1 Tax=Dermacentor silvarum TaxID=543639 RepID=A0ACB8DAZ6_DERSI|nr:hypothetical protein HPB49_004549 [Dermacentor silvarum]